MPWAETCLYDGLLMAAIIISWESDSAAQFESKEFKFINNTVLVLFLGVFLFELIDLATNAYHAMLNGSSMGNRTTSWTGHHNIRIT